ncbi:DNA (cytosine-5-)-methyltransferase [Akkermansiaceae bacterium]|nr:DNA (cytosine-5-)-methyltransferase [Akkermansiaceae bacterium]
MDGAFKIIDLFAGIGGLRMGFEAIGGNCVFTSEWNRFAVQTYQTNFSDAYPVFGDITTIDESVIPDHDILLAGFPCQPFSLAGVVKKSSLGRKHGFEDETQGTLFFDVARILNEKRPKSFLLENVKNLVSHDKGRTMQVVLRTLREIGYKTVEHRVISSAPWVPQKRERIFIAGFLEQTPFTFSQVLIPDASPTLDSILHDPSEQPEVGMTEIFRGRTRVLPKYTLSDKLWAYLDNYGKAHRARGNGFGCTVNGPQDIARTLSARYYKDGSEILIRQKNKNPRMLTPRECARLMGYDSEDHEMIIPVSNVQAYKQFGNGVCVPVIRAIAKAMVPHIIGTYDPNHSACEDFHLTS